MGGEFPELYDYINKIDDYIFKNYKKNITVINQEKSFEDYFYTMKKSKNKIYGFPYTIGAWCNDRLKQRVFNEYFKKQGEHIRYIGIAYDEPKRIAKLQENARAPLVEWKMTEQDCIEYLKSKGLENPLYNKFKRLGCWFCPKQNLNSLRILRKEYPEYWSKLLEWQKDTDIPFKPNYSMFDLEEKFKKEG